jgi:hypothetical protein
LFAADSALSQNSPSPAPSPSATPIQDRETAAEEDPTKPILFSIRDEYRDLRSGGWSNTVIFRVDRLAIKRFGIKGGSKGVLMRFDVPFVTVHRGTATEKGLGDLYGQALYFPQVRQKRMIGIGSGIVIPTATGDSLGAGKLILSPSIFPVWYFKRRERFFLIRIQNYISVAGKSNRPNINYMLVAPALVHRVNEKWWLGEDTEFKWDWQNKLSSAITGLQVGRMLKSGFGFWLKPEVPWGPGRSGGFNLKFTFFHLR